jgi:hypothetical protein
MNKNEYQTTRIWVKTHTLLRKIAAETGESIVEVLHRLVEQEARKVKVMKSHEQQVIDQWAEGMLNAAVDEMDEKNITVTPESFSTYFQENYDLSWTPAEAQNWLEAQDWYQK